MKIKQSENFEPCPEFTGRAVCVDVTPLRKQQSEFGERDVFKVVFEIDKERDDKTRFAVWSKNFTPSLNEKANFRKFLRGWFGRDLNQAELSDFDTETLIGKPASVVVVHEHKDGKTYANIVACTPDKGGNPLKSSGTFVRRKDRADETEQAEPARNGANGGGAAGGYRRSQQPAGASATEHGSVKIHVGRCTGLELRDLSEEQVNALVEKWLPGAKSAAKQTADDKRLIAALEWFQGQQQKDDLQF
jgi:hypothetical protein